MRAQRPPRRHRSESPDPLKAQLPPRGPRSASPDAFSSDPPEKHKNDKLKRALTKKFGHERAKGIRRHSLEVAHDYFDDSPRLPGSVEGGDGDDGRAELEDHSPRPGALTSCFRWEEVAEAR